MTNPVYSDRIAQAHNLSGQDLTLFHKYVAAITGIEVAAEMAQHAHPMPSDIAQEKQLMADCRQIKAQAGKDLLGAIVEFLEEKVFGRNG